MNNKDFVFLVAEAVDRTASILQAKGNEYASDEDRLANFKRNADKIGQTTLECWQVYWGKHVDAINSYMARVHERAIGLALEQVIDTDKQAQHQDNGDLRTLAINPSYFRKRVIGVLPQAMAQIDATLSEPIEGRFYDNINYSLLCLAILKELRDQKDDSCA